MAAGIGQYSECPICKKLHDDGVYCNYENKTYYLCLDCGEDLTENEKIRKLGNQKEGANSNAARK